MNKLYFVIYLIRGSACLENPIARITQNHLLRISGVAATPMAWYCLSEFTCFHGLDGNSGRPWPLLAKGHKVIVEYQAAKVFTATKAKEREELGENITHWLRNNPNVKIRNTEIRQSSDNEFHCLSIIVFYDFQ